MNGDNRKKIINAAQGIDDEGLELCVQSNHRTVGSNTSQQCPQAPSPDGHQEGDQHDKMQLACSLHNTNHFSQIWKAITEHIVKLHCSN
jgi:hypothetical protein